MDKNISFNEEFVRKLAVILKETELTEIEFEIETARIRVARQISLNPGGVNSMQDIKFSGSPIHPAPVTPPDSAVSATPAPITNKALHPGAVKSPMVGSAYLTPAPGAAPFVKVGDKVTAGQTIMIIEAMKVMNPIKAPKNGIINEILIDTGSPIEFDQILMIID